MQIETPRIKFALLILVLLMHNLPVIRLGIPTAGLLNTTIPIGRNLKSRFWWIMLSVGLLRQISYHVQAVLKIVTILQMFFSHVIHQVRRACRSSRDLSWFLFGLHVAFYRLKMTDQFENWDNALFSHSLFDLTNRCRKQCVHSSCSFIHRHWSVSIRWVKWKRRHIDGQKKWCMGFS